MAYELPRPRTRPELLQRLPAGIEIGFLLTRVKRGGITPITVLGRQPC